MKNYKKLMKQLERFEKVALWDKIESSNMLKVRIDNEDYYITILGNAGIEKGIAIYRNADEMYTQLDFIDNANLYLDSYARAQAIRIYMTEGYKVAANTPDYELLEKEDLLGEYIAIDANIGLVPVILSESDCLVVSEIVDKLIAINDSLVHNPIQFDYEYISYFDENNNFHQEDYPIYYTYDFGVKPLCSSTINELNGYRDNSVYQIGIYYLPMLVEGSNEFPVYCGIYNETTREFQRPLILEGLDGENILEYIAQVFTETLDTPNTIKCINNATEAVLSSLIKSLNIHVMIEESSMLNQLYNYICEQNLNDESMYS